VKTVIAASYVCLFTLAIGVVRANEMDRATVSGFPLKNRDNAVNDRRMMYDSSFFDYQTLYRFGK
jgi:hypothetical protein